MKSTMKTWQQPQALEEEFLSACENDGQSIQLLSTILEDADPVEMSSWPDAVSSGWRDGLSIVFDDFDRSSLKEAEIGLILRAARAGFDNALFRDALSAAARKEFGDYMDPSGLITALEIQVAETPTAEIMKRWDMFLRLQKGEMLYHYPHGYGKIMEIDTFGNEIRVSFAQLRIFKLKTVLDESVLVEAGSFLGELLEAQSIPEEIPLDELSAEIQNSLHLTAEFTPVLLERLIVPALLSRSEFMELTGGGPGKRADGSENVESAEPERHWDDARGLAELVDLLTRQTPSTEIPAGLSNLEMIFRASLDREDHAAMTVEAVSLLWKATHGAAWFQELLNGPLSGAVCWKQNDLFVQLSDNLAGKLTTSWFAATIAAEGPEYLLDRCMKLPLRLWTAVEKALTASDTGSEQLMSRVMLELSSEDVSADLLLWLWKSKSPTRSALANARLLFRTLADPVRGSYLLAQRNLRRLLMNDREFQRVILKNGDPKAVSNLVRCIRHMSLLDSGERQSLLVKIVRLYPEARPLVEQRSKKVKRKPIGKITSPRSYTQRQRDLTELVEKKIPANSRAIAQARSYGDLRENAEFKAAKDEQAYLAARRSELEQGLHEVRPADFTTITVGDRVIPGCTVTVEYESNRTERFHLLGLWDSVPEEKIISYDSPLGKLLVGKTSGESFTAPSGEETTVTGIEELSRELKEWTEVPS